LSDYIELFRKVYCVSYLGMLLKHRQRMRLFSVCAATVTISRGQHRTPGVLGRPPSVVFT